MKYQLLKEVLSELEEYELLYENISLSGFRAFLNDKAALESEEEKEASRDKTLKEMSNQSYGIENHITYLIAMMWKYAKHYAKDGFKDLPIHSLDDFGFLAALSDKSMNKTELINLNVAEVPSGMDIIKRLTKQGLIISQKNDNDKRAKMLSISPLGRAVVGKTIMKLQQIAQIVVGNLEETEKNQLFATLEKLNRFHQQIHENHWKSDLEEVKAVYL
jgi:MarR family transcriptional regulator, lower aerobic nicotinate degradation pathway regulator